MYTIVDKAVLGLLVSLYATSLLEGTEIIDLLVVESYVHGDHQVSFMRELVSVSRTCGSLSPMGF